MRKLIVNVFMSLDGFYEGTGKDVTALFDYRINTDRPDETIEAYSAERLRAADTLLFGRTSFEGFRDTWPSVADDESASPTQREISRLDNAIEKVVVSDSLTTDQTEPWRDTTRIVRRSDAHAGVAELKRRGGRDILILGSHILWNDLMKHGLVDELHAMVLPIVLGAGTPAFDGPSSVPLELIDTRTWEGSQNVVLRYAVRHKQARR